MVTKALDVIEGVIDATKGRLGALPRQRAAAIIVALDGAGLVVMPKNSDIPARGPQTARLCAKPDFGRARVAKRKPRA